MTPFERWVRAAIYQMFVAGAGRVDAEALSTWGGGWPVGEVESSLRSLADAHRIAMQPDGAVWMAHPFSGVATGHAAVVDGRRYEANCSWDSLAILAMLGDGQVLGPDELVWRVSDGTVTPDGLVHLVVPAASFWEDIGFT
jgi:hypothetical protein